MAQSRDLRPGFFPFMNEDESHQVGKGSLEPGYFMNNLLRPRNWEPACGTERSAASANYMADLPGVLGCRALRRTVQVRLGTNTAVPRDGCQVAQPTPWSRDSNSLNIRARGLQDQTHKVTLRHPG